MERKPEWLERKFKKMILRLRRCLELEEEIGVRGILFKGKGSGEGDYGHVGAQRDLTG
jgi:hypothetical protein